MELMTKILNKTSKVLAIISAILIILLAIMYTCDIAGRFLFGTQLTGSFEIAQFMLCLITFLAFPYAQTERSHIHVAFLINKFPAKIKYVISAIGFLFCSIIGGVMVYALILQGYYATGIKLSTVLKIPFAPIYYITAALMVLFVIILLCEAIRSIYAIKGNDEAVAQINKIFK